MRIGVHLVNFNAALDGESLGPTLAAVGRAAEDAGVDNLSCMDHYFQLPAIGAPDLPMLEGYSTLAFLAAHTRTVELQLLVTGVTYRHPGLLAKVVTTLDQLSSGRAVLGLGAAWFEEEHRGLGIPFPPLSERFERLEETLQIARAMFAGTDEPFEGRHYRLERTLNSPPPVRIPPIMVGGSGERKTLRLVAKYADACNLFANPDAGPDAIAAKLAVLAEHCEREGTDAEAIRKTILWAAPLDPVGGAAEFAERMHAYAEVGISDVHVMNFGPDNVRYVRDLGEHVVPAVHAIG